MTAFPKENAIRYQQEGGPTGKGHIPVLSKFNGRDSELGAGLYVTDTFIAAQSFAGSAANFHRGLKQAKGKKCSPRTGPNAELGFVCIVEARVSSTFRSTVSKMWIPGGEVAESKKDLGNDPEKLKKQEDRIKKAEMDLDKTLRFSIWDVEKRKEPDSSGNQFMLPPDAFEDFVIRQCLPATDKALVAFGVPNFPDFNYRTKTTEWNIRGDPLEEV
ncbi:hypothetical protein PQX77_020026 [Marasmius sp. AFHP31]|nr:hypothetical protein PQX77_020026 [Marasmius sp. AFHP31]